MYIYYILHTLYLNLQTKRQWSFMFFFFSKALVRLKKKQSGAPIQKLFPGVAGGPAFVKVLLLTIAH